MYDPLSSLTSIDREQIHAKLSQIDETKQDESDTKHDETEDETSEPRMRSERQWMSAGSNRYEADTRSEHSEDTENQPEDASKAPVDESTRNSALSDALTDGEDELEKRRGVSRRNGDDGNDGNDDEDAVGEIEIPDTARTDETGDGEIPDTPTSLPIGEDLDVDSVNAEEMSIHDESEPKKPKWHPPWQLKQVHDENV